MAKKQVFFDVENSWREVLGEEIQKEYFLELEKKVDKARREKKVFPKEGRVFQALKQTPLEKVKCVLLGQDPYHGENQAEGLCFSVPHGTALPPSLKNIYKELERDLSCKLLKTGSLGHWAEEGVLLLNTFLTVEEGKALSHSKWGWDIFVKKILETVLHKKEPVVFLLWGKNAQELFFSLETVQNLSPKGKEAEWLFHSHLILETSHPSPFSANKGFLGCSHFSKANKYLISCQKTPISWEKNV